MALFPFFRILFWTDWDANFPRIESASMSGAGRKTIYKDMKTGQEEKEGSQGGCWRLGEARLEGWGSDQSSQEKQPAGCWQS